MKLTVKLGKEKIGTLEVSTIPGISHTFELNKKRYEIIKTSEDSIEVIDSTTAPKVKPTKPESPGEK